MQFLNYLHNSQYGKPSIQFKRLAGNLKSWECVLRRKGECKAKVKLTNTDGFVDEANEHMHPPPQTKVEVAKIRTSIKRKAATTQETPRQILAVELFLCIFVQGR